MCNVKSYKVLQIYYFDFQVTYKETQKFENITENIRHLSKKTSKFWSSFISCFFITVISHNTNDWKILYAYSTKLIKIVHYFLILDIKEKWLREECLFKITFFGLIILMFSKIFKGHSAVYIEARVHLDKKRFSSYKA